MFRVFPGTVPSLLYLSPVLTSSPCCQLFSCFRLFSMLSAVFGCFPYFQRLSCFRLFSILSAVSLVLDYSPSCQLFLLFVTFSLRLSLFFPILKVLPCNKNIHIYLIQGHLVFETHFIENQELIEKENDSSYGY